MAAAKLGVQCPPSLIEKRVGVCHVVRKTVLESIFKRREKAGLVEKLSGLNMSKTASKVLFRCLNDCLKQRERHTLPNNGC